MLLSLKVKGFRNLQIGDLSFSQTTTVFLGQNGQGKTNILEAIHLLSYGKPFRVSKDGALAWGSSQAEIVGETKEDRIQLLLQRGRENQILINSKKRTLADLFGRFVTVLFHPAEIEILTGEPSLRRNWLDKLISTLDKTYLYSLVKYSRAIKNKNRLLKVQASDEELDVWDSVLAEEGAKLWAKREETVAKLNKHVKILARRVLEKALYISYKPEQLGENSREIEKEFLKNLERERGLERKLGITVFGPHRDDFKVETEETKEKNILVKDLADYGSRAEQRQAVILLKLAQAELFKDEFGSAPTVLLDDVTSELDAHNRDMLLQNLSGFQTVITATEKRALSEGLLEKAKVYQVKGGEVSKE